MSFRDLTSVYSKEWHEDIEYYASDLRLSNTVQGAGMKSGSMYELTFDDDNNLMDACLIGSATHDSEEAAL